MSVYGVSIRQLSPVLLKDRQWSSARIAVEGACVCVCVYIRV